MAFADPQVIPFSYGNSTVPRVGTGDGTSTYRRTADTGAYDELVISHQRGKRNRHVVRLNLAEVNEDPITEQNFLNSISISLVVDAPLVGIPMTTQAEMVKGLCAYLTASSGAAVTKLLAGES